MIKRLFKKFKCFKGVFPSDKLPYGESLPLNIIANTDPSYMQGQNWVAISIDKVGRGIYFDSFGLPPINNDLSKFMKIKCKKGWRYNKTPIQHINSNKCGNYCVLFVIHRCQGIPLEEFILMFKRDTSKNEVLIKDIFKNFSLVKYLSKSKDVHQRRRSK